mgnify:CR=1 FL=1
MEFKNLNNFGKKLQLKRRIIEEKEISEEEIFIDFVSSLIGCWNKSNKIYDLFKLNILEYEEDFYRIIEDLIFLKYGPWKTELILWYIFARVDIDGNIHPLIRQSIDNEDDMEEILLTTPKELWDFLIDVESKRNNI